MAACRANAIEKSVWVKIGEAYLTSKAR